ncbi:hypothetical protein I3760_11G078700 [Carya illinoinensis]|nr:hypothetical protein I3760_11G078700 [Carya illinoinensis]
MVFLLCLLAGCSICWFNTVCFVLCNQNFPSNQPLAISLTVSFKGVSAAFYALAATAIDPSSDSTYLLINALIPLLTSIVSLIPILCQPSLDPLSPDEVHRDSLLFLFSDLLAVITSIVFSLWNHCPSCGPFMHPWCCLCKDWFHRSFHSFRLQAWSGFILVDADDLEIHKELLPSCCENGVVNGINGQELAGEIEGCGCCQRTIAKDQLAMLGEEHPAPTVVRRLDFWLYCLAYFCGGTIGLVYSNNVGQIAQKFCFARTGWLTIALLPTRIAFLLLAASGSGLAQHVGTALSSGFIFAAAVSITSEPFGPNSVVVNHNVLITNIPIGSLVYGCVAAVVYDANTSSESAVCIGRQCYFLRFVRWVCMSILGLACSVLLFLRTRHAYNHFEQNRMSTQPY